MAESSARSRSAKARAQRKWLGLAITVAALTVFAGRVYNPEFFERVDTIALGLLAIAALPWLSAFVEEFKIPGVVEARLRELEEKVVETRDRLDENGELTEEALAQQSQALPPSPKSPAPPAPSPAAPGEVQDLDPFSDVLNTPFGGSEGAESSDSKEDGALLAIAERYMETRSTMKSGPQRTARMTSLFHEMMAEAERLGPDGYDAVDGLSSNNAGRNLASVAHTYTFPDKEFVTPLIGCIRASNQPFVHYWALKSLQKIQRRYAKSRELPFCPDDIADLRELQLMIPPGTDSAYVIGRINEVIDRTLRD